MFQKVQRDLKTIRVARNWQEIIRGFRARQPVPHIQLRKGINIQAPADANLLYVFEEVFIKDVYKIYPFRGRIVDIGANVGFFAAYALNDTATIEAYEPFEPSAICFRAAFKDFPNVLLHQKAVAGEFGRRSIRSGSNWLTTTTEKGNEVEAVTLDSILPCDLLKIDCEGDEYEILFSSKVDCHRIVGEYHDLDEKRCGRSLCDYLVSRGFRIDLFRPETNGTGMFAAERT